MRPRSRWLALLPALLCLAAGAPAAETPLSLREAYSGAPATWPRPHLREGAVFAEMAPPAARDGPDAELAALGKRLFFDPALSASGRTSCAGCHRPERAYGDDVPLSVVDGGRVTRRNTPGLLDVADVARFDWDGKAMARSLRVLAPLTHPGEMGPQALSDVEARTGLPAQRLGDALVAFLETLAQPSRFDRFLAGDEAALDDEALRGLHLFRTKAGCANCHSGPRLSDDRFHNLRLSSFGEASQDLGHHAVTGSPEDAGRFRTPSLRHVSRTAPYMHNGLLPSLRAVVNFYARGGGEVRARGPAEAARPLFREAARLSPLMSRPQLSEAERESLVAFLRSL